MRLIYRDVGVYVYWSCEEKLSINLIELISYLLSNLVLSMRYLYYRKCFNLISVYLLLFSKCQLKYMIMILLH